MMLDSESAILIFLIGFVIAAVVTAYL